jgi:hypothetical protein
MAGLNYGQGGIPGISMGTTPAGNSGGPQWLNDLATIVEGSADIFRQVKGLPPRYNTPLNRPNMAGQNFGRYIDAMIARRLEEQKKREEKAVTGGLSEEVETPVDTTSNAGSDFLLKISPEILTKIFTSPDVFLQTEAIPDFRTTSSK